MSASASASRLSGRLLRNPFAQAAAAAVTTLTFADVYLDKSRTDNADDGHTTHLSRIRETPRPDWKRRVRADDGGRLTFATLPGVSWGGTPSFPVRAVLPSSVLQFFGLEDPYWNESASYRVTDEGMWMLERASYELHSMILEAVEEVVSSDELLEAFGMPRELWPSIRSSWERRESDLMGRFDLLWDGEGFPKMVEYNADTPTVLIESGAAQRNWLEERRPDKGQFNVLEEALEDGWRKIAEEERERRRGDVAKPIITIAAQGVSFWNDPRALGADPSAPAWKRMFAWALDSLATNSAFQEEAATAKFLHDTASRAAAAASDDLPGEGEEGGAEKAELVDFDKLTSAELDSPDLGPLWKLYPWEWLVYEDVGERLRGTPGGETGITKGDRFSFSSLISYDNSHADRPRRRVLEPPWKLVASSKVMLAYLWRKHPGHPNLLPAALADELPAAEPSPANRFGASFGRTYVAKPALGREGDGLKYSDEDCHGDASLRDFAKEARDADRVLILPDDVPEMPVPVLSSSPPTAREVFRTVRDRAKETTLVSTLLDRGLFSKVPDAAAANGGGLGMLVGPAVVQKYHDVATLHGRKVVASSWVVRGVPVAACFREDNARTTNNNSCFVPHWVEPTIIRRRGDASVPSSLEQEKPPGAPSECGCPPRPFPSTANQDRLRTELYGSGPALSTGYGTMRTSAGRSSTSTSERERRVCFGAGGRGGRGVASTGGGGPRVNAEEKRWAWNRVFGGGSGRARRRAASEEAKKEAARQTKIRRNARATSASIKKTLEARNKAVQMARAKHYARTGAHGRGATRGSRGYSG